VLNYIPAQDQSRQDRAVKAAMPALAPLRATPANDVAPEEIASHPPGCTCAVHLAWRKKKVGAGWPLPPSPGGGGSAAH
jgi:5-methyltetrahydrofolate--homocysteine methyltransferase